MEVCQRLDSLEMTRNIVSLNCNSYKFRKKSYTLLFRQGVSNYNLRRCHKLNFTEMLAVLRPSPPGARRQSLCYSAGDWGAARPSGRPVWQARVLGACRSYDAHRIAVIAHAPASFMAPSASCHHLCRQLDPGFRLGPRSRML